MRRVILWLLGATLPVVVLDQITKQAAVAYLRLHDVAVAPFLSLTLTYNTGAAFGFLNQAGGWQNLFFIGVAIIASAFILYLLHQQAGGNSLMSAGLALILGGAIGNLIDRLLWDHVIDFILVYYRSWRFPAFNIADSAITVGAVLLLLDAFGVGTRRREAAP
jgi:signal peptidase II